MEDLLKTIEFPPRIRFMLMDTIELRNNQVQIILYILLLRYNFFSGYLVSQSLKMVLNRLNVILNCYIVLILLL